MKKLVLLFVLLLSINSPAQFKGTNVRKLEGGTVKPSHLKLFSIYPKQIGEDMYVLSGRLPGKAEAGFLIRDRSDKLSFSALARFWSKSKKVRKGDDYAFQLALRECGPPKGYDGELEGEAFVKLSDAEMMYWRKYKKAFNIKEQDSQKLLLPVHRHTL